MRTTMRTTILISCLAIILFAGTAARAQKSTLRVKSIERATIETSLGNIEIELYGKDAPKTVANFVEHARKGYFNGVKFHRIARDFVIQTGDPTGTGYGGESIYGKPFEDELKGNTQFKKKLMRKGPGGVTVYPYKRGILAMANLGRPKTNTSQFFIILKDTEMPPQYTIFGRVVSGMDVVDRIAASPIIPVGGPDDGKPKKDIVMKKVSIQN
jgi:cyclophilin family peptidyl-prolyl cis-trans isomerase